MRVLRAVLVTYRYLSSLIVIGQVDPRYARAPSGAAPEEIQVAQAHRGGSLCFRAPRRQLDGV